MWKALDVRDPARDINGDVTESPLTPSPGVPGRFARFRVRGRQLAITTVVVIAVVAVSLLGQLLVDDDRRDSITPVSDGPATGGPWLPGPWALAASDSHTWAAGDGSPYRFCGSTMVSSEAVHVAEQSFVNPSGLKAHLIVFTPEAGEPMDLFKFAYASCLDDGNAEGVPGPHNRWAYGSVAGASGMVDDSLHVVELEGTAQTPTPREAEAVLEVWADR